MSNIQAAIGLAQLQRIESLIQGKRRIFETYREHLAKAPVTMNPEPEGVVNGYWMPTVVVDSDRSFERQALLDVFKANHIDGRVFFWPLSDTGHFECRHATPVAHGIHLRAINLPSYHDIGQEDIGRVSNLLMSFLN